MYCVGGLEHGSRPRRNLRIGEPPFHRLLAQVEDNAYARDDLQGFAGDSEETLIRDSTGVSRNSKRDPCRGNQYGRAPRTLPSAP